MLDSIRKKTVLSPKDKTHFWRIQLAATNIYHIERWAAMPGGLAFYYKKVADAMDRSKSEGWDFEPDLKNSKYPVTLINGDEDFVDPVEKYWRKFAKKLLNYQADYNTSCPPQFMDRRSKAFLQSPGRRFKFDSLSKNQFFSLPFPVILI